MQKHTLTAYFFFKSASLYSQIKRDCNCIHFEIFQQTARVGLAQVVSPCTRSQGIYKCPGSHFIPSFPAKREQDLGEMVLPADRGVHAGKAYTELQILRQPLNLRYTNLKAGAAFWGHTYFEILLHPESDLASLSELPAGSTGLRLRASGASRTLQGR